MASKKVLETVFEKHLDQKIRQRSEAALSHSWKYSKRQINAQASLFWTVENSPRIHTFEQVTRKPFVPTNFTIIVT